MTFKRISLKSILLAFIFILISCTSKQEVDLIISQAQIYSVDQAFSTQEAMAIHQGKILAIGSNEDILAQYSSSNHQQKKGQFIYPGLIDAHAHLYNLGMQMQQVNLTGFKSFDEVIQRIQAFQQKNNKKYIIGRGWDQTKWPSQDFPTKDTLDVLFPDTPIALSRIDGHAMLCNTKALELANIDEETEVSGGAIFKNEKGELTGVLIDNPMQMVFESFPEVTSQVIEKALTEAEKVALSYGLTTISDAGLSRNVIETIDRLQQEDKMKIRLYAMVSNNAADLDYYLSKPPYKTERLNVRSVKVYADGALGSRGAALKEPYSDHEGHFGSMVIGHDEFSKLAKRIAKTEFQMNTHAIGDSANISVLKTYQKLIGNQENRRWRVEHAQVLGNDDFSYFSKNILPSVQPTHATSDMYWAEDRLGSERIKNAYAYKKLLDQVGILPLGTDFPVEKVSPMLTFYAAVSRQDTNAYPKGGFQPQNALSREEALRGMTIWAAYSNFEEDEKGSLESGKFADFIVLNEDLMQVDLKKVPDLEVIETFINGEKVYDQ
ncbi:amidohydrolase [Psychroflexus planctonicus]|uniref:Amidohydrolase n=1 Tax=Psychroflexus planctonicus TaxID=1526575 RepID=A0ABQ1SFY1_9FLAO|nr:amidohydrolase [Psychroflexus planctonicus]GGE27672.1 amidohydrolase [Psychroflexus planctonicus]